MYYLLNKLPTYSLHVIIYEKKVKCIKYRDNFTRAKLKNNMNIVTVFCNL